jgi:hypothetical protein
MFLLYFLPPNNLLMNPGSFGSFACPWQRSFFATPLRAVSMWLPQPDQVGLLHLRHVVLLHITVVDKKYIYTIECWGVTEEVAKEKEAVEQCVRAMKVKP